MPNPASAYPIEITKAHLVHKGGTKEYYLTLAINANGFAVIIKRWGAIGATGQVKVEKYNFQNEAKKAFDKAMGERQSASKSYILKANPIDLTAHAAGELSLKIGRTVFPRIGADAAKHLDPNYNTDGMRDPVVTRDEDDNYVAPPVRGVDRAAIKREEERLKAEEQEREMAAMKTNPNFGRF